MKQVISKLLSWDPQENTCLHGHTGAVWSVKPTSDDSILFSGSEDCKIIIWDLQSEEIIGRLSGHTNTVNALELCLNEEVLVSGAWDGAIKIWDWKTQVHVGDLVGHTAGVYIFVLTKDSGMLVSGSGDYTARIWNVESRECLGTLNNGTNSIFALALTPDEKLLVTGGWAGIYKIWDFSTYQEQSSHNLSSEVIQCMVITPNGSYLIIGTRGNKVKLINWVDKTEYMIFEKHNNWVRNLVITQDSKYFLSASADKTIRMVNISEKKEEICFDRNDGYVFALCFGKTGEKLYSGASDKLVRIRTIGKVRDVKTFKGHTRCIMCLSIAKNGQFFVTGSEDTTVRKWSLETYQQLFSTTFHTTTVWGVCVTDNNEKILSVSGDHKFIVMTSEGNLIERLSVHQNPIFCVASSTNSKLAATGSQDKNVVIWNIETHKSKKVLEGHTDTVFSVVFYDNNQKLLSGSADYTIKIWCTRNLILVTTVKSPGGMIEKIAISPDSKLLICGDRKNLVHVWDWVNLTHVKSFDSHSNWVKSVAFASDGKTFASCSNDCSVRVWNAEELYAEFCIKAHKNTIRSVSFSHDCKFLISASEDSTAKLWLLGTDVGLGLVDFVGVYEDFILKKALISHTFPNTDLINYTFFNLGINLLHFYSYLGNDKLLDKALEDRVQVKKDANGKTPLFYALERNHRNCVESFLRFILRKFYVDQVDIIESYRYFADDFILLIRNSSKYLRILLEELIPVSKDDNFSWFCYSELKLPVYVCSGNEKTDRKLLKIKENQKVNKAIVLRSSKIPVLLDGIEGVMNSIVCNECKEVLESTFITAIISVQLEKYRKFYLAEFLIVLISLALNIFRSGLMYKVVSFVALAISTRCKSLKFTSWLLIFFIVLTQDLFLTLSLSSLSESLLRVLSQRETSRVLSSALRKILKKLTVVCIIYTFINQFLEIKHQETLIHNSIYPVLITGMLTQMTFFLFMCLLIFELFNLMNNKALQNQYWVKSLHRTVKDLQVLESFFPSRHFASMFIHSLSNESESSSKLFNSKDLFFKIYKQSKAN